MALWNLPREFEPAEYRTMLPELAALDEHALRSHYVELGRPAGVPGNRLEDRNHFARLVPAGVSALEIAPFASPVLSGPEVRYCDVLDTPALRARAVSLGWNPAAVVPIHYRLGSELLDGIAETFEVVLSSHVLEHQPDLVGHLGQVERRLRPGGRYMLFVPDHRFCFDRHLAPSTIAEVLQAYEERRQRHTLRSVIEHRALTVGNDVAAHWNDPGAARHDGSGVEAAAVRRAIAEYRAAAGAYIDVHAWYFTPDSFAHIMRLLVELGFTRLVLERIYPTRRYSNEFWAVLIAPPTGDAAGPPAPLG